jgi:serine/threonine protein kinase
MTSSTSIAATLPMCGGRRPRLQVGEGAGRYRLTAVLGSGAMGVVYRGFDPVLGRDVALKSLHVQDACSRQRFVLEARAMARLSHPNVVQVFDVVRAERPTEAGGARDDAQWLIAMELVEGVTLDRWLQTPRSVAEIRETFAAAGRGLAAAHAAGLVHRDFKPANVIVGRDGRVRVTDFGLSVSCEERAPTLEDDGSSTAMELASTGDGFGTDASGRDSHGGGFGADAFGARALTFPGLVVGTPAYMAPEQHRGATLTPATDQFAFCAALFEALFDERPFDGRSCKELSQQKHCGDRRPARGSRPVPAWLRRVVLRGLHVEPRRRFASMLELLAALEGPQGQHGRWRPLRVAMLLALVGSGLGVAWTADGPSAAESRIGSAGTLAARTG